MSNLDNEKDYSVDCIINELEDIYSKKYKPSEETKKLYEQVISSVEVFKNTKCLNDVLYAVKDIINSNTTYRKIESITWGNIFVILGLWIAISSNIIMTLFSDINMVRYIFAGILLIIFAAEVILYLHSLKETNEKNMRKCFYELVYNILSEKM